MACGCNSPNMIDSWIAWTKTTPKDPLDLIAYAAMETGGTDDVGVYTNSTDFGDASGAWGAGGSFPYDGDPVCVTLAGDRQLMNAEAEQWNFDHQTRNDSANLAPALRDVVFLRGGRDWEMQIPVDFGGTPTDVQLSFLDNAGTRGDYAGTIPVIAWSQLTGTYTFKLALKQFGRVMMGMRCDAGGTINMYESEWIVVL